MILDLDLLRFQSQLRVRVEEGEKWIYDPVRKKELVMTDEEIVRQLILCHMMETMEYPAAKIRSETKVTLNGMPKRCDILVYDQQFEPWLLVECKAPSVKLTYETAFQASTYNMKCRVPYLVLTNGLNTVVSKIDFENERFDYMESLPTWIT